jgi:NAD(P)-dependent dehydrogenase (short-subunit alcohol dehydrogenase family)
MWNKTWDVNVSGTVVLTESCMSLLLKSSNPRLLFLTSGTASLTESAYTADRGPMWARLNASPAKGWPKEGVIDARAYRSVKTGLNMMMREWRRLLKEDGVKVWVCGELEIERDILLFLLMINE